jgi:hypothetical protein
LAGAAGGALLGAPAAGIGAIPGAILGGLGGYFGADAAIGGLRQLSGQDPRSPLDRLNGVKRTDVLAGIEDGTHRLAWTQPIPKVPNITNLADAAEASARFDKAMIARNEAARPQWDADTAAHNKEYAKFTHITAPGGRSIALAKDTPQNSPAAPSAAPEVAAPARGLRNSAGVLQQQGPTRAELGQILSRGGTGNKEMDSMIAMQLLGMNSDNKSDVLRSMSNTESAGVQRYGHDTHLAAAKLPYDVAEQQRLKLAEYYKELDAQPGEPGKPKPTVSVGGLLRRGIDPTSFQSAQRFNSDMRTADDTHFKGTQEAAADVWKNKFLKPDGTRDEHAEKNALDISNMLTKGAFGLAKRTDQATHQQDVQELTNMFSQMETPRKVGTNKLMSAIGLGDTAPTLSGMPNFKNGTIKQLGPNITAGTGNNDYELTDANGKVHYMSNMSQRQRLLLDEMGIKSSNRDALRK